MSDCAVVDCTNLTLGSIYCNDCDGLVAGPKPPSVAKRKAEYAAAFPDKDKRGTWGDDAGPEPDEMEREYPEWYDIGGGGA